MDVIDALCKRRSIRRFQDIPIPEGTLSALVEAARFYPSGGNMQPVRFAMVTEKETLDSVFANLKWAMYLPDFQIEPWQRPKAYILLLTDQNVKRDPMFDVGAAAQSIMLGAMQFGLSSCCLGITRKDEIRDVLGIGPRYAPVVAIALGYAGQASEAVAYHGTFSYTQTDGGDLRVPKYALEDVLLFSDGREG